MNNNICKYSTSKSGLQLQKHKEKTMYDAAIWFNKIRKIERLTPKYIQVKVNGSTRQSINTWFSYNS
jgi:hypothetical protein